jgi:hypothetical protein
VEQELTKQASNNLMLITGGLAAWKAGQEIGEQLGVFVGDLVNTLSSVLKSEEADKDIETSAQDKKLSPGEIEKLEDAGHDVHELKGGKNTGQIDLYKTPKGDIVIKGKGGKGPGGPNGLNLNDL